MMDSYSMNEHDSVHEMSDHLSEYNLNYNNNINNTYNNIGDSSKAYMKENDVSRLRNELTEKNLLLLEARSHAMSSEAQLRTELARKNAELAQSNSEIRRLKSTQPRSHLVDAPILDVKTFNPIEEEANELRKRVKIAFKKISSLKKEIHERDQIASDHNNAAKLAKAQLEVAKTEINQLKNKLEQSSQKQEILTNTLSTRLSSLEQECTRLRAMAMKKSSETAELEKRLDEALIALQTSRADTRTAMTAARKSQVDEEKLVEIEEKYVNAMRIIRGYEKNIAEQAKRVAISVALRKKLTVAESAYEKEKNNNIIYKDALMQAQHELGKFRTMVGMLKSRLSEAEKVSEEYRKIVFEKERLETLYSEEKGKLKNAIQRIRRLESDIVEITSIEHDNIDNVHKPSVINKLELEKTGLTKDLFETKKALRQCQERIISLETTHRTYEESLFKQKRINSDTNDNMSNNNNNNNSNSSLSISQNSNNHGNSNQNLLTTVVLFYHLRKAIEKIMNGEQLDEDDVLEDNVTLLAESFNLLGKTEEELYEESNMRDFNRNIRALHKQIVENYALQIGAGECINQ